MIEFDGIVIRKTPFKDYDAMVNVLNKDGFCSFLAKGVLKFESKNSSSTNLFTKSKFCLFKGKDGFFLKKGTVIESYQNCKNTLLHLTVLDFLSELTNFLVKGDDGVAIYPVLEKILEEMNKGFDPYTASLIYISQVLKNTGYSLEVDKCSICGKTGHLTAVSYKNGGFICNECFRGSYKDNEIMKRKLKILKYSFKVDVNSIGKLAFEKDECLKLLDELTEFISQTVDIQLKSIRLLKKI